MQKLAEVLDADMSLLLKDSNFTNLTDMNEEDTEIYQNFLAPIEGYKE